MTTLTTERILGIEFVDASALQVVNSLKSGGLLVVPAAPGLITIKRDKEYYKSLKAADVVIPDSGYMVLIWRILKGRKIKRISGLEFLVEFLSDEEIRKESSLFLVDPRPSEAEANMNYLRRLGFQMGLEQSYIAPMYGGGKIEDEILLSAIEEKKPKFIIINLGGGIQEKVGAYLKANLTYRPAIICTGAAIAFLTGKQATIPAWADKLFMGWFVRCIFNPRLYIPRYLKSFKLIILMVRYGKSSPPQR